jgi:hypothetical protein
MSFEQERWERCYFCDRGKLKDLGSSYLFNQEIIINGGSIEFSRLAFRGEFLPVNIQWSLCERVKFQLLHPCLSSP